MQIKHFPNGSNHIWIKATVCDEVVTKTVAVSWFDGFADAQLPGVADEIRNISFSSWRQKILIEIEIILFMWANFDPRGKYTK